MDKDEIPSESPPAYTDIAPSATCYPGKPPPYSVSDGQQCDPPITPHQFMLSSDPAEPPRYSVTDPEQCHSPITPHQFMLSDDHPSATFPLDTEILIPPSLPRQPNQQHQQQQVGNSTLCLRKKRINLETV